MTLCKGCRIFQNQVFEIRSNADYTTLNIAIHANYGELVACAESSCDLCKFLRRELWYFRYVDYVYRPHLETSEDEISIDLAWTPQDEPLEEADDPENPGLVHWRLNLGSIQPPQLRNLWSRQPTDALVRRRKLTTEQPLEIWRQWLVTCKSMHAHCDPNIDDGAGFLPTMLLDVGMPGQESIKLIRSREIFGSEHAINKGVADYITLSYCWGLNTNAACTTKENLDDQLREIPIQRLPHTIHDAVQVTRACEVRYLWVDALCIVQDASLEDENLQAELSNMGRIYRHSLFTIAASSAENSHKGLFSRTESSSWAIRDYHLTRKTLPTESNFIYILKATPAHWNTLVENSILSTRGWVFQERMSATRTLFFTDEGTFWQCNELRVTECNSEPALGLEEGSSIVQQISVELVEGRPGNTDCLTSWNRLISRYSKKALTRPTDRLPAIQGVLSDISKLSGVNYSMGVLDIQLIDGLDWFAEDPRRAKPEARLPDTPSWSWASVDQPIAFENIKNDGWGAYNCARSPSKLVLDGRSIRLTSWFQDFRVRRSWAPEKMGVATSTRRPLNWTYSCVPACKEIEFTEAQFTSDYYAGWVVFDTSRDESHRDGETITCILWKERCRNAWSMIEGESGEKHHTSAMIVSPVEGEENTYRRRGWIEIEWTGFFRDESRDVILV